GTGKATLSRIMAAETVAHFVPFSAVTSGIKEVKEVMAEAVRLRRAQGRRTRVIVLEPLQPAGLVELMRRALDDSERGMGASGIEADDDALETLAQLASGDARRALNLLELAAADAAGGRIDAETVRRVAQRKVLLYDKSGEEHYNLISALHKSLRESDPDAAIYWLARMLAAGEDPLYVARRMIRFASED